MQSINERYEQVKRDVTQRLLTGAWWAPRVGALREDRATQGCDPSAQGSERTVQVHAIGKRFPVALRSRVLRELVATTPNDQLQLGAWWTTAIASDNGCIIPRREVRPRPAGGLAWALRLQHYRCPIAHRRKQHWATVVPEWGQPHAEAFVRSQLLADPRPFPRRLDVRFSSLPLAHGGSAEALNPGVPGLAPGGPAGTLLEALT